MDIDNETVLVGSGEDRGHLLLPILEAAEVRAGVGGEVFAHGHVVNNDTLCAGL